MRHVVLLAALVLLAGCGEDDPPQRAESPGTLIAALGDSITAGSPAWDPDPDVREQYGTGANPESQYEYWAQLKLGRGHEFRNCGVSGERTDEIAERLEGCAEAADVLIVQGGINDIAQGRPPAGVIANLRRMVREGKDLGLRVVIVELLPWNNGGRPEAVEIAEVNRAIAAIGRDEGVRVLPWHDELADPRDPARMLPELTADGDHPSVEGYKRIGRLVDLSPPP